MIWIFAHNIKRRYVKRTIKWIIVFFLILAYLNALNSTISFAQKYSSQVDFEQITTQEGLPHNNVINIIQDRYGFMWFSTKNGLCRYDGYDFTLFQQGIDSTQKYISDNNIMDVCLDSANFLWVATLSGGLNRIHTHTGKTTVFSTKQHHNSGFNDDKVISILCDKEGTVWVGTWTGLYKFDHINQKFYQYHLPNASKPNHIFTIHADDSGVIWVATEEAIYHFDPNSLGWSLWKSLGTVYEFKNDTHGFLWMGGSFGLMKFHYNNKKLFSLNDTLRNSLSISDNLIITAIESDSQGNLWFGTINNGIIHHVFSQEKSTWDMIIVDDNREKSLSNNNIRTLYCDKSGIVWIGTRGGGVNKYYPNKKIFTYYDARSPHKILFDLTTSLVAPSSHNPLIVGARNGIYTYNQLDGSLQKMLSYQGKNIPELPYIMGAFFDNARRLWIATRNGCYLFEPSEKKIKAFFYSSKRDRQKKISRQECDYMWEDTLVPTMQISTVLQDRYGDYWFGTRGGGVYRLDSTFRNIKIYRHNYQKIDENRDLINVLYKDNYENIWAGTDDGLLMLDREKDKFTVFQHQPQNENSISNNKVQTIYQDHQGLLWVGTYFGLNVLNLTTREWKRFYSSDGVSSNIIYGIIGELTHSNVLWISTVSGLSRALLSYYYTMDNTLMAKCNFTTFGHNNGLPYAEFVPNGISRGPDGNIYLAHNNGALQLKPDEFIKTKSIGPPSLALTKVKVFGKPVSGDIIYSDIQPLYVEEKDNVITFEFVGLSYYYSSSNQYSYFLDGFDNNWSEPSNQRQATYTNLSPGIYTFKVKASNYDGIWSPKAKEFVFIVNPPWWKTRWAYLSYAFIVIALLFVFIRYREHRQRQNLVAKYQKREAEIIFQKNQVLAEANTRLLSLNTELEQKNQQLQDVNEEKTDIVNVVVHDLKNPVIGIQKLAYSLESFGRKSAQEQIVQSSAVIKHTAERMYSLIQQLLRVHAVEQDKNTISCILVDIRDITEQYIEDWVNNQYHVRIRTEYHNVGPFFAYVDPLAFLQILENLLTNAAKVSEINGEIIVSFDHHLSNLVIMVEDFGRGIEKEQQEIMFKKFSSLKKQFDSSSSGLGLYIVKKLVEAMNGSITFETVQGQGTIFRIIFPTSAST